MILGRNNSLYENMIAQPVTISAGSISIWQGYHEVSAESGVSDSLDTINTTASFPIGFLILQAATGESIAIEHGTGNIYLSKRSAFVLDGDRRLELWYDGTQWSDTSAIADTVVATYKTNTSQAHPGDGTYQIVNYDTQERDTHSAVSTGASWVFTAPRGGNYVITASLITEPISWSASDVIGIYLYVNGSVTKGLQRKSLAVGTEEVQVSGTAVVTLSEGDTIDIRWFLSNGGSPADIDTSFIIYNYIAIRSIT